jgi:hypothetical protein
MLEHQRASVLIRTKEAELEALKAAHVKEQQRQQQERGVDAAIIRRRPGQGAPTDARQLNGRTVRDSQPTQQRHSELEHHRSSDLGLGMEPTRPLDVSKSGEKKKKKKKMAPTSAINAKEIYSTTTVLHYLLSVPMGTPFENTRIRVETSRS